MEPKPLKPCPYCDGEAELRGGSNIWWVECAAPRKGSNKNPRCYGAYSRYRNSSKSSVGSEIYRVEGEALNRPTVSRSLGHNGPGSILRPKGIATS